MALYRVLKTLDRGVGKYIYAGGFTRLEWLAPRQQQALVDVGAVSEVSAPPLAVLPGWKTRAAKLEEVGIEDIVDFLDADEAVLCQTLHRAPQTVAKYRDELTGWLVVDEPRNG